MSQEERKELRSAHCMHTRSAINTDVETRQTERDRIRQSLSQGQLAEASKRVEESLFPLPPKCKDPLSKKAAIENTQRKDRLPIDQKGSIVPTSTERVVAPNTPQKAVISDKKRMGSDSISGKRAMGTNSDQKEYTPTMKGTPSTQPHTSSNRQRSKNPFWSWSRPSVKDIRKGVRLVTGFRFHKKKIGPLSNYQIDSVTSLSVMKGEFRKSVLKLDPNNPNNPDDPNATESYGQTHERIAEKRHTHQTSTSPRDEMQQGRSDGPFFTSFKSNQSMRARSSMQNSTRTHGLDSGPVSPFYKQSLTGDSQDVSGDSSARSRPRPIEPEDALPRAGASRFVKQLHGEALVQRPRALQRKPVTDIFPNARRMDTVHQASSSQ